MWLRTATLVVLCLLGVVCTSYDTSMVERLLSDRDGLVQDGLSYFNGTTVNNLRANADGHNVRCIITIENWTKWMLSFPVTYTPYGDFQFGYHEREIFAAHREVVVAVNKLDSITGSSGVIAWELGEQNIHVIVMWSIPYNMNFYNAYFAFGMVHLSTKFSKDMLPYWYKRMIDGDQPNGINYRRSVAGQSVVFKHNEVFILGSLEKGSYSPVLNASVMPWSTKNLAPSIWHQLYLQTVREKEAQPYSNAKAAMPDWTLAAVLALTCGASLLHILHGDK